MASQYDIPWHMLKGLDPENSEFCTLKGSVTTGLEPSARDEIAYKLRSVAYCARGRVFFDVKMDQVAEALKLRSLDHIYVLVYVEPKFSFTKNKALCLRRLRLLPRQLDWKKALSVWQRLSGYKGDPHTRRSDDQLEAIEISAPPAPAPAATNAAAPATAAPAAPAGPADPVRDMVNYLRQPVKGTRPDSPSTKEAGGEPAAEPAAESGKPEDGGQETAAAATGDGQAQDAAATEPAGEGKAEEAAEESADATAGAGGDAAAVAKSPVEAAEAETEGADKPTSPAAGDAVAEAEPAEAAEGSKTDEPPAEPAATEGTDTAQPAADAPSDATPTSEPAEAGEKPSADADPEQKPSDTGAGDAAPAGDAKPAAKPARIPPPEGAVTFRATCFRAGGGKQGHAFSSNEGAENFGGAVQDLFNWKVQMKGYELEVILHVDFDMVSVGLSLTPSALFYRNLVKMGPTSLRSTVCYSLLMMAKPQPYEVIVDPMCGGGSISLEGAQAFPGTYHICGDNYPDAAPRTVLNREFSARQLSPSAALAVDVFTWDCTRLPLRDACADVICTDLPFGKRMGSKFDNRTLYPAVMEEMARICTPRYGRAVLLTQDKRTMEATLHLGRIKNLWRCRASPYVNIGGLEGRAYLLQRSDYVRRHRPPPPRSNPAGASPRRGPRPPAEGAPAPAEGPPAEGAPAPAEDTPVEAKPTDAVETTAPIAAPASEASTPAPASEAPTPTVEATTPAAEAAVPSDAAEGAASPKKAGDAPAAEVSEAAPAPVSATTEEASAEREATSDAEDFQDAQDAQDASVPQPEESPMEVCSEPTPEKTPEVAREAATEVAKETATEEATEAAVSEVTSEPGVPPAAAGPEEVSQSAAEGAPAEAVDPASTTETVEAASSDVASEATPVKAASGKPSSDPVPSDVEVGGGDAEASPAEAATVPAAVSPAVSPAKQTATESSPDAGSAE